MSFILFQDNDMQAVVGFLAQDPSAAVLDERECGVFAAGHLRGAVSMPGVADLAADPAQLDAGLPSIFLPPRHRPLLVVAATGERAQGLARALAGRGRARLAAIAVDESALERLPAPWVERGPSDRTLWQPPHWLVAHAGLLPPPALGPVLDLGCGSGRAAVWLAARGYRVTGVDWQPEALVLAERLAASRCVPLRVVDADVRAVDALPPGPWAVVVNIRCLDRGVLARMGDLVGDGGVAVVRTFREAPGLPDDVTARHRLRPGELVRAFAAPHWDVLAHEEGFDDDGRPAAGIVARRRGGRAPAWDFRPVDQPRPVI